MDKIKWGNTGLEVTELCFGALPIGPIQKNVPVLTAAKVIAKALEMGVTFVDTAQGYKTYPHLYEAMKMTGIRPVITTKSPATTYEEMEAAIHEALEQFHVSYIDVFLLHAARASADVFEKRKGAYDCLIDYKKAGKIKAVGISAHDVGVIRAAAREENIDVVFPILNLTGMGILNGTRLDMEQAIESCVDAGKAVYLMKVLAGGNIVNQYDEALKYARAFSKGRMPIAVGMVNEEEVEMNLKYFDGEDLTDIIATIKAPQKEFLAIPSLCTACGTCIEACHSSAISIQNNCAVIDNGACLTCGYCVGACPQFAIRMI